MKKGLLSAGLLILFCAGLCRAAQEDIIKDLSQVKGIKLYNGPEPGKKLLKKNGFVVVPAFSHRIFTPYLQQKLPHFITADSVHRTFHVIFEDELKKFEAGMASHVLTLTKAMTEYFRKACKDPENTGDLKVSFELCYNYFQVAYALLHKEGEKDLSSNVKKEIKLIKAAAKVNKSPLFKYRIDYTQFKPRGFYAETAELTRYFRALTWYGQVSFRLINRKETMAAFLISDAMLKEKPLFQQWERIDSVYTSLIWKSDDLTPEEYAGLLKDQGGTFAVESIETLIKEAWKLRDSKINSMAFTESQMFYWQSLSKGMRFLGKRYIPDSEVFMNLTDPKVKGRGFPNGLDLLAANGSKRAAELMKKYPVSIRKDYKKGMAESKKLLSSVKNIKKPSHYIDTLKLIGTLTEPPLEKASAFAKTDAYADKSLMSALASWASLRHAWVLHGKQSVICLGAFSNKELPGYIEPNPAFFKAMHSLIQRTIDIFSTSEKTDTARLRKFKNLVERLMHMLDKQIANGRYTVEEFNLFMEYGERIGKLQGFDFNYDADSSYPWMALITDVHSEMLQKGCLQAGTGGAMPIYVIVEKEGVYYLLTGGVYSYYEFTRPISERLTDEKWRDMWSIGRVPELPPWTASFIPQPETDQIIRDIKKGERPEIAHHIEDPALSAYLLKAVQPDGELHGKNNYCWAYELAYLKQGHKGVPQLLKDLEHGSIETARAAAGVLLYIGIKEDLDHLVKLVFANKLEKQRIDLVKWLVYLHGDKGLHEGFVKKLIHQNKYFLLFPDEFDEFYDSRLLQTSKDILPCLIEWCEKEHGNKDKNPYKIKRIIDNMRGIWSREHNGHSFVFESAISDKEIEKCRRRMEKIALRYIKGPDAVLMEAGIRLAGDLKCEKAVPVIQKLLKAGNLPDEIPQKDGGVIRMPMESVIAEAFGKIGTDRALEILMDIFIKEFSEFKRKFSGIKYNSLTIDFYHPFKKAFHAIAGKEPEKIIPFILDKLKSRETGTRLSMTEIVNEIGFANIAEAVNRLDKPDKQDAISALTDILYDNNEAVRLYAAFILGKIDPENRKTVPVLINTTSETEHISDNIKEAICGLEGNAHKDAVSFFVKNLTSDKKETRYHAAYMLSEIASDSTEAVPVVLEAMKDGRFRKVVEAVENLKGQAREEVMSGIKKELYNSRKAEERMYALEVITGLDLILETEGEILLPCLADKDPDIRERALELTDYILNKIPHKAAAFIPYISMMLKNKKDNLRKKAIALLGKIGPSAKGSVKVLKEMLDSGNEDEEIKAEAVKALIFPHTVVNITVEMNGIEIKKGFWYDLFAKMDIYEGTKYFLIKKEDDAQQIMEFKGKVIEEDKTLKIQPDNEPDKVITLYRGQKYKENESIVKVIYHKKDLFNIDPEDEANEYVHVKINGGEVLGGEWVRYFSRMNLFEKTTYFYIISDKNNVKTIQPFYGTITEENGYFKAQPEDRSEKAVICPMGKIYKNGDMIAEVYIKKRREPAGDEDWRIFPRLKSAEEYITDLKSEDLNTRIIAAYGLHYYNKNDNRVESVLIKDLDNKDYIVRINAARVIAEINKKKAIPKLIQKLDDNESDVRIECAGLLLELGYVSSRIVKICLDEIKNDSPYSWMAFDYLAEIGPPAKDALPELNKMAKDGNIHAAKAVWHISGESKKVLPVLISEIKKKQWLTEEIPLLLGDMGPSAKNAIPVILKFFDRDAAFTALWEIGKPSLPSLIKLLENEEADIRKKASIAIGMMGKDAESAIPDLLKLLIDKNDEVKQESTRAIRRIRNRVKGPLPDPPVKVTVDTSRFPRRVKVTVTNLCPEEIRIWQEWGTPGWDFCSFVIKDDNKGCQYMINKTSMGDTTVLPPAPPPYEIPVKGSKDIFFDLKDGNWMLDRGWAIPNEVLEKGKGKFIRVVMDCKRWDRARTDRVVIGKFSSDWAELE